jgi:ATP-dependent DNA helicase RecQ
VTASSIREVLKQHWGHAAFRARQEEIVTALIDGRDAVAVMPTGGGKSLCYQIPPVVTGRLCVVVSPLIALMRDQVAQLEAMGIAAAAINSGISPEEKKAAARRALRGELRLLYLSPERLVQEGVLDWLERVNPGLFAIDEAHCISEWGHEFRPDYRQLRVLRERFPGVPIAAFTASATRTVRQDIVRQLGLRDPAKIVQSFRRPNLRYFVREADSASQNTLLKTALRHYAGSVIVYAPTVLQVESLAANLRRGGLPVTCYHGQMEAAERELRQEEWMSGRAPIMVGTLAFGLGINKPDVRAVIHLSLTKSLEQYYQEAGRAGRDGKEADCFLLWQRANLRLLAHFVEQVEDEAERQRAWRRWWDIRKYAESAECRQTIICRHFGEEPKWGRCGCCDACGFEPEWLAEAVASHSRKPAAPKSKRRRR